MIIVQLLPELNEGGVERGTVDIAKFLDRDGIKNYVISNGGKLEKEVKNHIKFDICSKNIFTFLPRVFGLRKILKELKPSIVHVRSRVPAWILKFAKFGLKFKVVSTVHGINSVNFYSKIMVDADIIICGSTYTIEYITKHFNPQIKNIRLVHRGVDLSDFNPKKLNYEFIEKFKQTYNINESDFIVTSVGRITHWKSYETLIKTTSLIDIKNIKVFIVGGIQDGRNKYFESLVNLVKTLNLTNVVFFTGSISKIAEIYALSDVVVSASTKPESFGRSVAEAISLNTPVVASNHGGVKDIIISGENGYFFEPLNEKELAEKILMAKELNFDGFSYIKSKFSVEKMYNQTLQIYKEVVGE